VQTNYFLALPKILLLAESSAMMLQHLQFPSLADQIEQAMLNVLANNTFSCKRPHWHQ
jgi:isocitrate/isopropylmalate dehydrogenase